jgi:methionine-S-sulfoxide reductase
VIRTRVGYTGGQKLHPTYTSLGDHTETLQIDYDPGQISYEALLQIFWDSHNPTRRSWGEQYKAAVFVHNEEQAALAEASKVRLAAQKSGRLFSRDIRTEIIPASTFYLAEDYHQKYFLQNTPRLWGEIANIYREPAGWINSTAAARLNGYLGRRGTMVNLEADIDRLGLSPAGQEELRRLVGR